MICHNESQLEEETVMTLTLKEAEAIIDGTLAKAREMNLNPMCVAVLDAGGYLIALKREDNAPIIRPQLAIEKAWTAVAFGVSTADMEERAKARPWFIGALADMQGGKIVPVAGALPIRRDGVLVGAVGATGAQASDDEICCRAGLAAAGLA
jgi:uncharacterized protein GlcG (DUF336 family)